MTNDLTHLETMGVEELALRYKQLNEATSMRKAQFKAIQDVEEKEMVAIKAKVTAHMQENGLKSIGTSALKFSIVTQEKLDKVKDFGEFMPYVLNSGRIDFLQQRVSEKAVLAEINRIRTEKGDANATLPGVKTVIEQNIRITKVK